MIVTNLWHYGLRWKGQTIPHPVLFCMHFLNKPLTFLNRFVDNRVKFQTFLISDQRDRIFLCFSQDISLHGLRKAIPAHFSIIESTG